MLDKTIVKMFDHQNKYRSFKNKELVKLSCLSFALLISISIFSQDFDRVYFNSRWFVTSIENSTYYRISKFDSSRPSYAGETTDFYVKDNRVEMTGFYSEGMKNGSFIFYFPNGNLKMKINYTNNERAGIWTEYYENGIVKMEVCYENLKEKLLVLNDSKGNSLIKRNKVNLKIFSNTDELPLTLNDFHIFIFEEELHITGSLNDDNERDGKWIVKKNNLLYATLSYSNGYLLQGYIMLGNQKLPLNNNQGFPLFTEPQKFFITEKIALEPDAKIKNNYVLDGLNEFKMKSMERITINSYSELVEYFNEHFVFRSNKTDQTIKILIEVKDGIPINCSTEPKVSVNGLKEINLIIGTIEKFAFNSDSLITIDYHCGKD